MSNVKTVIKTILLALAVYGIFTVILYTVNSRAFLDSNIPPAVWAGLNILVIVLYIATIIVMITIIARLKLKWWVELIFALSALLLFLIVNPSFFHFIRAFREGVAPMTILANLTMIPTTIWSDIFSPILLILTGVFFGALLSRIIRESSMVLPVAIVISLIDIWGVCFGGFMDRLAETAPAVITEMASATTGSVTPPPEVMQHASPVVQKLVAASLPDTIGFGDFLFLGFFMFIAFKFSHSIRLSGLFMGIGILAASLLMSYPIGGSYLNFLPGLPFLAGGYILANIAQWKKLTKEEWIMTIAISAVVLVLIIISALFF